MALETQIYTLIHRRLCKRELQEVRLCIEALSGVFPFQNLKIIRN